MQVISVPELARPAGFGYGRFLGAVRGLQGANGAQRGHDDGTVGAEVAGAEAEGAVGGGLTAGGSLAPPLAMPQPPRGLPPGRLRRHVGERGGRCVRPPVAGRALSSPWPRNPPPGTGTGALTNPEFSVIINDVDKITVIELANKIQNETDAYLFMESIRWPHGPVCPHCGSIAAHYFLRPANSASRKTRTGAMSYRRVWKCKDCRKQFSVITGTVMHGSKASLRIWLFVIFEMAANKNGIAAFEIQRKYGIANRTAWFMCHRVREAMVRTNPSKMLGVVIADETWIGGDPKNMHAAQRAERALKGEWSTKTPVVSLIDAATGEVRSQAVADVSGKTLRKVINANVEMAQTTLHTDGAHAYKGIGKDMAGHESVDHSVGEYVWQGVSTNKLENYFAQLKRSIDGTHHHVSVEHLPHYLSEFDFRYSTRKLSDTERMIGLTRRTAGRRLPYKRSPLA